MKVKECIQMFKDFYQDFDDKKALELVKKLSVDPDEKMKHLSKGTKERYN